VAWFSPLVPLYVPCICETYPLLIVSQRLRHIRNEHTGASKPTLSIYFAYADQVSVLNPTTTNISAQQRIQGSKYVLNLFPAYAELMPGSALKLWVLSGGWKNAQYVNEPGYVPSRCPAYAKLISDSRGPAGGPIDNYATALERIA